MQDPIVILGAVRTPIGKFNGYFKDTSATELGTAAIQGALAQAKLSPNLVTEVIMGCVLPAGLGQAPARQAALGAGVPVNAGCTTINKVCGSGMKAIMFAHNNLSLEEQDIIVAGGMENMTRAPYLLTQARFGYRLGSNTIYDHMMLDGLEDAYTKGQAMGVFAEQCATEYNFTREQQDEYALRSLQKSQQANSANAFFREIIPVEIIQDKKPVAIDRDEGPLSIKAEKIPTLKPAFVSNGTVTAANSSSIADGAAALVLTRKSLADKAQLTPLAVIRGQYTHAQQPELFTTAPIGAIRGLLAKLEWDINEVDLFEINEAFAVVVMAALKELDLPLEKINVNGGACVLGHPIGASGARIVVTLIHALRQRNLRRGIAALCIGGGEATALAIEII